MKIIYLENDSNKELALNLIKFLPVDEKKPVKVIIEFEDGVKAGQLDAEPRDISKTG